VSRVLLVIGVLLLLPLVWTGVSGAIEQYPGVHTTGQGFQTAAQLALGVSSALTILVTFWGRRWRLIVFAGFALSAMLAGGLAPVVWGQQGLTDGLLAGAASVLIAQLIIWLLVMGTRQASPHAPDMSRQ
jgi:hypothetical protein